MSTVAAPPSAWSLGRPQSCAPVRTRHYLNEECGLKSWLLTHDHKNIAVLYFLGAIYLLWLLEYGKSVGANPWTPPGWSGKQSPGENFVQTGIVAHEAHNYQEIDAALRRQAAGGLSPARCTK